MSPININMSILKINMDIVALKVYSLSESSEAIEDRLDRPKLGGPLTSEVVPNSLYHPITIFDRFRSSNII